MSRVLSFPFGVLLREHRRAAGLTQEQLAARASISSQAVGALERGTRRFPHKYTVGRLADALSLDEEQRAALIAAATRPSTPAPDRPVPKPSTGSADATTATEERTAEPLPRQMPPPSALTGRDPMAAEIAAALREPSGATRTAVLVGPGGIGKTALAVAVGHNVAADFPDGQLYADLRGAHEQPADPQTVLGRFLRALGMPAAEVPSDPDERVAAYRSMVSGRTMLLVLDDAASEEQVRPLLPVGGSATIVTSRRHLGALLEVGRWTVPALRPADALELLGRVAGRERVAAERAAAVRVAAACGFFPLAICVAAGRLAVRPDWTVAELDRRLAAEHGRLDALAVGDLDVRASIGLSYRALSPDQRRLLRRLAVQWAPDFPMWVADELCGGPAEALFDELVNVHLVAPVGVDAAGQQRFRLHDLIAEFGRERARAEERAEELAAAVEGLLRTWLALASVADEASDYGYEYGSDLPNRPVEGSTAATAHALPADWLAAERTTLVGAVGHAGRLGHADIAAGLALRIAGFLRVRAYRDDHMGTLREALDAVRTTAHQRLRLRVAQTLFGALIEADLDAEMAVLTEEMLTAARRLGEPDLQARALMQASLHAKRRGRLPEAGRYAEEALDLCAGDTAPLLPSTALTCVATVLLESGRPQEALPLAERAVALQRTAGAGVMTALRLLSYGDVLTDAGHLAGAEAAYAEAAALAHTAGHEAARAYAELRRGDVGVRRSDWATARILIGQSLATFERLRDEGSAAYALRSLGDLALARRRPAEAEEPFRLALRTWQRLRMPLEVARMHARLEEVTCDLDRPAEAAVHRAGAAAILDELGLGPAALRRFTVRANA